MTVRLSLALIVVAVVAPASAGVAASSASVGLRAQLAPLAGSSAGGTFSGSVLVAHRAATVNWTLRVSGLSGRPTQVAIRVGKQFLPLCVQCRGLRGATVLQATVWREVALGHATLVVVTKAHPQGELRGPLRRR